MASAAQYDKLHLFIDGEWLGASGRKTGDVINPATGETIGTLPHASKADLDRALDAAQRGFLAWRKVSPNERAKVLRKAGELFRERADHIATQMTLEEGKTLGESKLEVLGSAEIFEWMAEECRRSYGRLVPSRAAGHRQMVLREPVGPVAAFSPWNFPAVTPARKIAASLAAGCSCIIKPAEETPATALAMAKCLEDAGLPKGVLSVVFGVPSEVSTYLIASPIIRKISFTGSTVVGKHLAKLAADGVKRATLELGGHAPVVIFDDVDSDTVAKMAVAAKYRNAGQVCISPTRFYVQENVHDRFVAKFAELAAAMPVGDGLDAKNKMGPLANARRIDAMEQMIGDARDHGAKVKTGGSRIGNAGYFWQPTVLSDVTNDSKIMNVEPFGPVAAMVRFKKFDEVVEQANRLPYGLASYAFTSSAQNAQAIGDALDSGLVGVNTFGVTVPETPFGGVKESGYGSEGGSEGLDAYLQTKFISQM
jgi:succinate-semialdehyde dehydrogenase / glutarate-semialdehyde dehydrogenase